MTHAAHSLAPFRTEIGRNTFFNKYAHGPADTWGALARRVVDDVCGTMGGTLQPILPHDERRQLEQYIAEMKFIPGGRYLYYAGRDLHAYQNCFLLCATEDTREEWAALCHRAMSCLSVGGGIGACYSILRPKGALLKRTGGTASGPIPLMQAVNEIGRNVMQGGSRRSAIYASLAREHQDIWAFLSAKNWDEQFVGSTGLTMAQIKEQDFNFPAPLDMTNISVDYTDAWLTLPERHVDPVFVANVRQAMRNGEPGFSFNFGAKQNEVLRNAPVCAETRVLTREGYRPVADLVGTPVTVWTGEQWAPDVVFKKTSDSGKIVRVQFTGGRSIRCDSEHPFLVDRSVGAGSRRTLSSIDRVPAGDLAVGDVLHVSLPPAPTATTPDVEGYTLGYLYGDGSFSPAGGADVSICCDSKLPCLPLLRASRHLSSITPKDSRGYSRVYFKSGSFGCRAKAIFPTEIFSAAPHVQASFLAGLFDADGNVDPTHHRIRLSSNHTGFLRDAARLLEQLGVLGSVSKNGSSTYGQAQTYQLSIMADYITLFANAIPTQRLRIDVGAWRPYRDSLLKVEAVTPDGEEPVYCADVKVPEHTFMAEGVIISNCCEITSEDDSDVCNLGSVNLANVTSIEELAAITTLAAKFLVCGTVRADVPYEKVRNVREKNRRLGLGLMGVHEWLLRRGCRYEMTPDLRAWLSVWQVESEQGANALCDALSISRPKGYRAIAPVGTIGMIAGTTTGIEPIYSVATKRRYLVGGTKWHYEYVIDHMAQTMVDEGISPDAIETAADLAADPRRRIQFQADVQDYVADHAISSTINLPAWGSEFNNEDKVGEFASVIAEFAPRLRGLTCYPDGSRGGQPLVSVPYAEAKAQAGVVFEEHDACRGGVCGL